MSTSVEPKAPVRFVGSRAEGLCLVLFTACAWGLTWPQSKFLLPIRNQRLWLLVFAMLNYGLFVVPTSEALMYLSASEAVTITYTLPIWTSILAWPMLGERLALARIVAILLGCGGVALAARR